MAIFSGGHHDCLKLVMRHVLGGTSDSAWMSRRVKDVRNTIRASLASVTAREVALEVLREDYKRWNEWKQTAKQVVARVVMDAMKESDVPAQSTILISNVVRAKLAILSRATVRRVCSELERLWPRNNYWYMYTPKEAERRAERNVSVRIFVRDVPGVFTFLCKGKPAFQDGELSWHVQAISWPMRDTERPVMDGGDCVLAVVVDGRW